MPNIVWDDKEKMTDALASEKYLTSDYNNFTGESATPEVMACFKNILCDQHEIAHEIFCEMNSRGWYQTEPADESKLGTVRQKFATMQ